MRANPDEQSALHIKICTNPRVNDGYMASFDACNKMLDEALFSNFPHKIHFYYGKSCSPVHKI